MSRNQTLNRTPVKKNEIKVTRKVKGLFKNPSPQVGGWGGGGNPLSVLHECMCGLKGMAFLDILVRVRVPILAILISNRI